MTQAHQKKLQAEAFIRRNHLSDHARVELVGSASKPTLVFDDTQVQLLLLAEFTLADFYWLSVDPGKLNDPKFKVSDKPVNQQTLLFSKIVDKTMRNSPI